MSNDDVYGALVDEFVMKVSSDQFEETRRALSKEGFQVLLGHIDLYLVIPLPNITSTEEGFSRIKRSLNVPWIEQQRALRRSKRSFPVWNDPMYPDMWYLVNASMQLLSPKFICHFVVAIGSALCHQKGLESNLSSLRSHIHLKHRPGRLLANPSHRLAHQYLEPQQTTEIAASTALAHYLTAWAFSVIYLHPRKRNAPRRRHTTGIRRTTPAYSKPPNLSCPHCYRTCTSRIGLVGYLEIHNTETGEAVTRSSLNLGADMNVWEAWELGYTGNNSVVTIMDDGIDYTHPDLSQNYVSHLYYGFCPPVLTAPMTASAWFPTLTCGCSKLGSSQQPHPGQPSRPVGYTRHDGVNCGNFIQSTALEVLGRTCRQHQDWFDDNDPDISFQLQGMCQETRTHLYTALVDLTKAFDTLNRDGL
ncbi:unnamed protein product [Schistocephalus solidus]|uniref:Peptidase_S8 domain-containing protein n=1 Tax=Schistocephalus solidus TaxID=70667 RepID=A0A183SU10_SCHSO|nr:unnamed protein product [Schistocephalus solidus]